MNNSYILNLRKKFPILNKKFNGYKLSYLDNAAITQVPKMVVESLTYYYYNMNANVHRGVYTLSEVATENYEKTRSKIKEYINAAYTKECIFVKGTTEAINLVSNSYVKNILQKGDEILISVMEHHSNIVPWFLLCKSIGAKLKVIPILESGDLDYDKIDNLLTDKTKFVSITHISNSLGTINDIKRVIKLVHSKKIPILIDGAQSISHVKIDVQDLDCDFFTISSHKMYGPSGCGILYVKKKYLDLMSPYQGGGDMVKHVDFSNIIWNDPPYKFEAGTPSIANIVSLGYTVDFLNSLDCIFLDKYKLYMYNYLYEKLSSISFIKILGNPKKRLNILSFVMKNVHSHDFGTVANYYGLSVRVGHHCSIPVMKYFNVSSTIRISFGIYNLKSEIDKLIDVIYKVKKIFYRV